MPLWVLSRLLSPACLKVAMWDTPSEQPQQIYRFGTRETVVGSICHWENSKNAVGIPWAYLHWLLWALVQTLHLQTMMLAVCASEQAVCYWKIIHIHESLSCMSFLNLSQHPVASLPIVIHWFQEKGIRSSYRGMNDSAARTTTLQIIFPSYLWFAVLPFNECVRSSLMPCATTSLMFIGGMLNSVFWDLSLCSCVYRPFEILPWILGLNEINNVKCVRV